MGFFSFNMEYYRNRLLLLEGKELTQENLYQAKQLLKLLDDLADEGYPALGESMEKEFSCISRLHEIFISCL